MCIVYFHGSIWKAVHSQCWVVCFLRAQRRKQIACFKFELKLSVRLCLWERIRLSSSSSSSISFQKSHAHKCIVHTSTAKNLLLLELRISFRQRASEIRKIIQRETRSHWRPYDYHWNPHKQTSERGPHTKPKVRVRCPSVRPEFDPKCRRHLPESGHIVARSLSRANGDNYNR